MRFSYIERVSWMAGFVDGEGCLTISKQVRKNRPNPSWRVTITIANTNKESLEMFKKHYGGVLRFNKEKRQSKTGVKWSDSWTWYCPVSSALILLQDIGPRLIVKRKQCEILQIFIDHVHNTERRKGGRSANGKHIGSESHTKETMKYRERLRIKIQSLNSGRKFRNGNN